MIKINNEAVLIVLDEGALISGHIQYDDGTLIRLGYLKKGNGNFAYDREYVYIWSFDKGMPKIFDVKNRCELLDREQKDLVLKKYKKYLKHF